ncbi:LLM class flavin-dependent oxidoreductase [Catenulispora subtropica]|uniref:Luciferase-like domain-containing protein n=1 Tax=Catenulispora subtropica TaxID=450798 RepID=A0ABN2RJ28_9ACTN
MLHLIASLHAPGIHEIAHFVDLARTAERGLLDAVFVDDGLAVPTADGGGGPGAAGGLEPLTLLAAVASATQDIGLIATMSTTFHEPYLLARALASLDHISHGRAGWTIDTGGDLDEAANFHLDEPVEDAVRYERAAELLDVVTQLWDSWADDAVTRAGVVDPRRVRQIEHIGLFFKVRGPLNVRRTPQGWPLLAQQAGSSADEAEFAARYAETVFTPHRDVDKAAGFAREVKSRAAAYGREPHLPLILPALVPAGRPEQIADVMQEWFEAGAADGFVVRPPAAAGGLTAFVNRVVPVLQRRGLFRSGYDGGTLRERFGLLRPEDHFPALDPLPRADFVPTLAVA